MKENARYFFASMIITVTIVTAGLLLPFAEYNTSKYISGTPPKVTELDFNETTVTVGIFGEKLSLDIEKAKPLEKLIPLIPNELRASMKIFERIGEYIGEAE